MLPTKHHHLCTDNMLPPEVWLNVCSYLDTPSLRSVSLTSWMLHQCASTRLWNTPTRPLHTVRHVIPQGWTCSEPRNVTNSPPPTPEPLNPLFSDYDKRAVGLMGVLRDSKAALLCRHYLRRLLVVYNSSDPWCSLDSEFGSVVMANESFSNLRDVTICVFGNGSSSDENLERLKEGFFSWCKRDTQRRVHMTCKNGTFLTGDIHKSVYLALHSLQVGRVGSTSLDQLLVNSSNLTYLSVCSSEPSEHMICLKHMTGLEYLDMDCALYSRVTSLPDGLKTLKITGLKELPTHLLKLVRNVHRLYIELDVGGSDSFCVTTLDTEFDFIIDSVRELHLVGGVSDVVVLKVLELTPKARVLVVRDAQQLSDQTSFESLHCKKNLEMISWSTQEES